MINNKLIWLGLIVVLSIFFRFYQLGLVPPSISWDEAAVGYNAWTITHYGRDEWGNILPLVFKSFEDDKHPVHFYLTAPFVIIFGLNDFAVRLAPALFGVFNVILIYLLGKDVLKSAWLGLSGAFLLAISPYSIQFSRFNHEANFALFFFMLGLWLFFRFKDGANKYLPWATLSFCLSILTYHSALVVVPPLMILLALIYRQNLIKLKKPLIISGLILLVFISMYLLQPSLLGLSRMKQTAISEDIIKSTKLYQQTNNLILGRVEVTANRYLAHFSPQYLFINGDKNPKFSTQTTGMFYQFEGALLILGLLTILKGRQPVCLVVLAWALLGPLPASLTGGQDEVPHAARALFTMGSWQLIEAVGLVGAVSLLRNPKFRLGASLLLVLLTVPFVVKYFHNYLTAYPTEYAIDWQYGMQQIGEHLKKNPQYKRVYLTDVRSQPYIFMLYYLKVPLPEFLKSVEYNNSQSRSYNLVNQFGIYNFGNWDIIGSLPQPGVLYVVTPSQYDGLKHRAVFQTRELVSYPNGTDAFYLVSWD